MDFQETNNSQLMRPDQSNAMAEEASRVESMLNAPPHLSQGIDRREMHRQLVRLKNMIETQAPKAYANDTLDDAVARERDLREEILIGMPTQEEMRRNPVGAVSKHTNWEERNKERIVEWKNIRRRLFVGGHLHDNANDSDHANLELYRPSGGAQELNMHNEQIEGTVQFGPAPGAGPAVVMTSEESAFLKAVDPDLHARMALLDNESRKSVMDVIRPIIAREKEAKQPLNTDHLKDLEWKDLQAKAKDHGIKHVGVARPDLEQMIARVENG